MYNCITLAEGDSMDDRYWCYSPEELTDIISRIIADSSIDTMQQSHVMFARDTRLVFIYAFCSCEPTAHMIILLTWSQAKWWTPLKHTWASFTSNAFILWQPRHVVYDLWGSYHVVITTGILTTPQLHYMVWSKNAEDPPSNVDDYYHKISTAFTKLLPEVSSRQTTPEINVMY